MSLLNWAWEQPTALERDYASRAVGYAMSFGAAQRMGESQSGHVRFGGAPVMLVAMRELIEGIGEVLG